MTASKADLRVLAVGDDARHELSAWPNPGHTFVLCETPLDSAACLQVGCERDWCTPGAWSGVVFALAEAGISKAGAAGVAELHRREVRALERANALAQAVLSVDQILRDTKRDVLSGLADPPHISVKEQQRVGQLMSHALAGIADLVDSVADDIAGTDPGKRAREVLAAHGWREGMFPALPGKRPHNWAHATMYGYAWIGDGLASLDASVQPPDVLRAFATLAEETKP